MKYIPVHLESSSLADLMQEFTNLCNSYENTVREEVIYKKQRDYNGWETYVMNGYIVLEKPIIKELKDV